MNGDENTDFEKFTSSKHESRAIYGLVFYLKDNTKKALCMNKFSLKQYSQIENEILKRNPEILVYRSAEEFVDIIIEGYPLLKSKRRKRK